MNTVETTMKAVDQHMTQKIVFGHGMTNATERRYRIKGGNSLSIGSAKSFRIEKLGHGTSFRSLWVTVSSEFRSYLEASEALDLLLKSEA